MMCELRFRNVSKVKLKLDSSGVTADRVQQWTKKVHSRMPEAYDRCVDIIVVSNPERDLYESIDECL